MLVRQRRLGYRFGPNVPVGWVVLALAGLLASSLSWNPSAQAVANPSPGFLSVILGRTLYAKGDGCQIPAGELTVNQIVPALDAMRIAVTAVVVPSRIPDKGVNCVYGDLYPSWQDLGSLRDKDGLTAVSGSLSYNDLPSLTPAQQSQDSCGTLSTFVAHGDYRAWGLFAYPNNQYSTEVQTAVVQNCFAFGRTYSTTAKTAPNLLTNYQSTMAAPWLQTTVDVGGGLCNDFSLPCHKPTGSGVGRYMSPSTLASLTNVAAGQWTALQVYAFVTGTNTTGNLQWDCSSPNWQEHWTSVFELYCWNDFVSAMSQIPSSVVVTDPATVAEAWGRTPRPLVTIDSVVPSTFGDTTTSISVTWHAPEVGNYTVSLDGGSCTTGTVLASGDYSAPFSSTSVSVPTSGFVRGQNTLFVCLTDAARHTGFASTTVTYQTSS